MHKYFNDALVGMADRVHNPHNAGNGLAQEMIIIFLFLHLWQGSCML